MRLRVLNDLRFTVCSLAAQGLYMRVHALALLMEAPGCLRIAGTPLTTEGICSRICVNASEAAPLFGELEACGLLKRLDGVLYAPDAEHEARVREVNRANGARGGRPSKPKRRSKTERISEQQSEPVTEQVTERITEPEKPSRGGTELTRWWDTEYQRTRGVPFDWVQTVRKDGKLGGCPDAIVLANLAKQFDPEDIKARITRYLESPSLFDAQTASPRMFQRAYATLAVQVRPLSKAQIASQSTPESRALAEILRAIP